MKYYPIFLNIREKRCVVVGGGEVAWRKVKRLLDCGARVVVISPCLCEGLQILKEQGRLEHIDSVYQSGLLGAATLVIGATDNPSTNGLVARDARERGIPANIVDDPANCDFIVPSLLTRGDLTLAISTAGKSPALARRIREELESSYGEEYGIFLGIMGRLRQKIAARGKMAEENRQVWEQLLASGLLSQIKERNMEGVRKTIFSITGIEMDRLDGDLQEI